MQILEITLVRRDRPLNGPTLKKNYTDSFLSEWSPHLKRCHDFALPEGY